MDRWRVTFTRVERSVGEELQDKLAKRAEAKGNVSFYEAPASETVEADSLTVEGGALVFWRDRAIYQVFGPSSYATCWRQH